jgi:arabinose-5-phosphate isomerase
MRPANLKAVRNDRSRALGDAAAARRVFDFAGEAIAALGQTLDGAFSRAVDILLSAKGRVIVSGMGKSGHIARKIAATFASTGTPAQFIHPAEASHGDLGALTEQDALLMLSWRGETAELSDLITYAKRFRIPLIGMASNAESTLLQASDVALVLPAAREACPMGLAPTTSTTMQMALGDALAVALLDARGFREEDFALSHPGGALGRKLLTHVSDLMRTGDGVPRVARDASFSALLQEMSGKGLGLAAIVDGNTPVGIFTDGDLRRLIERGADLRALYAADVMHPGPKLVSADALAVDAADVMEQHRITSVLVIDAGGLLVGALNSNDLMRAKVI